MSGGGHHMTAESTVGSEVTVRKGRLSRLASVAARIRVDLPFALFDVVFVVVAFGAILLLRFDGVVPEQFWRQ